MFLTRYLGSKPNIWRKCKQLVTTCNIQIPVPRNYSGIVFNDIHRRCNGRYAKNPWNRNSYFGLEYNRAYSKGSINGNASEHQYTPQDDLQKVIQPFPQPRVTLNDLNSRTPQQIFEVHYKQNMLPPKGNKKKIMQGDWVCTYTFVWPQKIKFESTALSKRTAAEKAATQALHWLYINKRINEKGQPIYDQNVIQDLRNTIKQPIEMTISQNSMERIERIWNEYESEIKTIYEDTFKKANQNAIYNQVLIKDSTIDEDDFSDAEDEFEDEDSSESKLTHVHPVYGRNIKPPSKTVLERRNKELERRFRLYDEDITPLPIDEYADQITSTLQNHRVTVIVGAAGCGKSTRVPAQILKECGANTAAIVSEPRRVAAIGLAQRVASELGEEVGESVGYQVRLHSKPPRPPTGSVLYCTSGVLLKRLQANPGLEGCTHVLIDEAHERDVNTDVTLLLLKRALGINPRLKVVIMSATLDTEVFTRYFDSCSIVEVPGRTFPVEVSHLNDIKQKYGLKMQYTTENCKKEDSRPIVYCHEVVEVIKALDSKESEGAILVFLPGWAEIKTVKTLLEEHYAGSGTHMILPVHSRLSTTDQTKMFSKPLPGIRKIVLSTNIAETSITIPDVVYVVDSGAHKENRIKESSGAASLETVWVSKAAANQRAGRAGRVQPGHCFRLYTKEKEAEFVQHITPEILRVPLEQTVLDCKTYAPEDKVEDFLSQLPDPPSRKAIYLAMNDLMDLGALTPSERLSRLGALVSRASLAPRLAAGVLHAAALGALVAAANVATHCGDAGMLFAAPADRRDEIREFKRQYSKTSDHAALHWIQQEYENILKKQGRNAVEEWCNTHGLRRDGLQYEKAISSLHIEQLLKSGFLGSSPDLDELTRFSASDELTAAILLSGCNSLLTTRRHVKTNGKLATVVELFTSKGDRAHIGSESVNYGTTKKSNKTNLLVYFGGLHSVERRALVVYNTSLVPPHTAVLFSKGDIHAAVTDDGSESTTVLSLPRHKLHVHMPTSQATHILKAKEMLWKTLQYYIDRDLKNIEYEDHITVSRFKVRLVKAIGRILLEGHREYVEGKSYDDEDEV